MQGSKSFKEAMARGSCRAGWYHLPSGWERCDLPSPNIWIERAAQTSIYAHMYSMCSVYSKWAQYKETMLYEHHGPQTASYSYVHTWQRYHNMYYSIINFCIPSSSSQPTNTHCVCNPTQLALQYCTLYVNILYILYVHSYTTYWHFYSVCTAVHYSHHHILLNHACPHRPTTEEHCPHHAPIQAWTSLMYSTHLIWEVHTQPVQ